MAENISKIKANFEKDNDILFIELEGKISIYESKKIYPSKEYFKGIKAVSVDFSKVHDFDSYIVVYLEKLKEISDSNSADFKVRGLNPKMESFIAALSKTDNQSDISTDKIGFLRSHIIQIGENFKQQAKDTFSFIELLGEIIIGIFKLFIRPGSIRWKDFPHHFSKAGVFAVPIYNFDRISDWPYFRLSGSGSAIAIWSGYIHS